MGHLFIMCKRFITIYCHEKLWAFQKSYTEKKKKPSLESIVTIQWPKYQIADLSIVSQKVGWALLWFDFQLSFSLMKMCWAINEIKMNLYGKHRSRSKCLSCTMCPIFFSFSFMIFYNWHFVAKHITASFVRKGKFNCDYKVSHLTIVHTLKRVCVCLFPRLIHSTLQTMMLIWPFKWPTYGYILVPNYPHCSQVGVLVHELSTCARI
jgi:hypothetical protein